MYANYTLAKYDKIVPKNMSDKIVPIFHVCVKCLSFRFSSITKTCPCKIENFHQKNLDIFLIFAQNIDCGYTLEPPRRGGFNEYPQSMFLRYRQSMFWSKNKKNMYTPAYPSLAI